MPGLVTLSGVMSVPVNADASALVCKTVAHSRVISQTTYATAKIRSSVIAGAYLKKSLLDVVRYYFS